VSITYLTQDGYVKLREKLDFLVKVRRKEIAKMLEHARSFGDLSENAEYDAAKEAQHMNEIQISELAAKISSARVIGDGEIAGDKVYFGATVRLLDLKTDEEIQYTLVSEDEADFLQNKISVTSPVGKGLLGKAEGDEVKIEVPAGILNYRIIQISR
jgi:transcription elongation factor GreA